MPNLRGNTYSKNHTHLESCGSCEAFWDFGIEESALFDYPEAIDYILKATGFDQLHFVGYSMATTQYLMMLSEMPAYNGKIKAGFLLGENIQYILFWKKPETLYRISEIMTEI